MATRLDKSTSQTVVITCTECPHWSAIRYGMDEAHRCAAHHETIMHCESKRARRAAQMYRARHAADS